MSANINVDSTTLTTATKLKGIARALAPVGVTLAFGIGCGILIEKMKKSSDTTEA